MDDPSLIQASAAVAMANSAIDNARRAAATSRNRRFDSSPNETQSALYPTKQLPSVTLQNSRVYPIPGTTEFVKNDSAHHPQSSPCPTSSPGSYVKSDQPTDLDLKHNDNAYHVVATLVTDRLLPKVTDDSTYYTVTPGDVEFFSQMLPQSIRKAFVGALRYRLQSTVAHSQLERLNLQCQLLGLDRERNVLLDLGNGREGMTYPVYFGSQGLQAIGFSAQDMTQNHYSATTATNGVNFGLSSPLSLSPANNAPSLLSDYPLPTIFSDESLNYQDTAESLLRQQITAEINETKFLLRGSVTPEAVSFWKKHLEELNQRLVTLSKEEQMQHNPVIGVNRSSLAKEKNIYAGEAKEDPTDCGMFQRKKQQYQAPNIPSQKEYLENNRMMRQEAGLTDSQLQPQNSHIQSEPLMDARVNVVGTYPPSQPSKTKQEELPVCDVVAPSDLPGGYMFEAQLGTKKFLATVPPGGVTKGQRFASVMRELETIEIPVPLGAWRDESCECFNHGVFHPLFLNTIVFPCVSLGQIMTRTGLDWHGEPANKLVSGLSCANMSVILTFWIAMNASALFMLRIRWERGMDTGIEYILILVIFNILSWMHLTHITRNVRESIRNKYQIPEERCLGCEDCMCATFCTLCTICHVGRHTADFDTYRGTCCTSTGLPRQVELAQVTFYEDQYENVDRHTSHAV